MGENTQSALSLGKRRNLPSAKFRVGAERDGGLLTM